MEEPIRYVVFCSCDVNHPIAYIADHRPAEDSRSTLRGMIGVTSPSQQTLLSGIPSTEAIGRDEVDARRSDCNLTETYWGDGHVEWTLRCLAGCGMQAQMKRDSILEVCDRLAAGGEEFCPLVPGEQNVRMIQLSVLCHMVAALNR